MKYPVTVTTATVSAISVASASYANYIDSIGKGAPPFFWILGVFTGVAMAVAMLVLLKPKDF